MIKQFCDSCEVELTSKNNGKELVDCGVPLFNYARVVTRIQVDWSGGEWCKHCVIDAFVALDDRPRVRPA